MSDQPRHDGDPASSQPYAGEHEEGQLTRQTEGLDPAMTRAVAGPDWDPDLVREADESALGQPLEGEIETDAREPFDAEDTDR